MYFSASRVLCHKEVSTSLSDHVMTGTQGYSDTLGKYSRVTDMSCNTK
jgi:hypothetical protein